MAQAANPAKASNIFLQMHPLQRILLSILLSAVTFFFVLKHTNALLSAMKVWIVFALFYLITGWIVLFTRTIPQIRAYAQKDDGSNVFVFIVILFSSLSSLFNYCCCS